MDKESAAGPAKVYRVKADCSEVIAGLERLLNLCHRESEFACKVQGALEAGLGRLVAEVVDGPTPAGELRISYKLDEALVPKPAAVVALDGEGNDLVEGF